MKNTNELQEKILEVLVEIDRIARLENLKYILVWGTALGAVRHHGYIPWDDDADILIRSADKERFFKALEKHMDPSKFFILKEYSLDWNKPYYKVMMHGTTLIENSSKQTRRPKGIFVDVFIAEKYPERKFRRKLYNFIIRITLKARGLGNRYLGNKRKYWIVRFTNAIIHFGDAILNILPEKNSTLNHSRKTSDWKNMLTDNMLDDVIDVPFEYAKLMIPRDYEALLIDEFGKDYMTPPPENERVGHHVYYYNTKEDWKNWVDTNNKKD